MLVANQRLETRHRSGSHRKLILSYEQRRLFRLRTQTEDGEEVHILLERGAPLAIGEVLGTTCGRNLIVAGSVEHLVQAGCENYEMFARACYHLGNRHVRVQIGDLWIRLQPDHVIQDMLRSFGCTLNTTEKIFEPEAGAYARSDGMTPAPHAHSHGLAHDH